MAAVFAGAARAPFTAILIVFEMTDDYRLILPLMTGVIISLIIAERLHPESIYTLKLTRRGIHLRSGRDVDVMESVRVEEVMVREPVTIPHDLPVSLLAGEFIRTGRHGFPVVDEEGKLFGVVSLVDYRRAAREGQSVPKDMIVRDITTRAVVSVFPDETVDTALRRMAPRDLSRLPVVARQDPRQLLGVVRRNDIVRAYEVGSLRREEARHLAEATRAVNHASAQFVEVAVEPNSVIAGTQVAELGLPRAAVLVSIRRGRELVIPHGDTLLQPGDTITALCDGECLAQVKTILGRQASMDTRG
jgi:CIC family chloride channel protein